MTHLVLRLFTTEQSIFSSRQLLHGQVSSTLQRILRHWQNEQAVLARFLKLLAGVIEGDGAKKTGVSPAGELDIPSIERAVIWAFLRQRFGRARPR